MVKNLQHIILDEVDKSLLRALQKDGRLSNVQLARKISLSPPATHSRLKRLEKEGYIRNYTVIVDPEKAGYDLQCFIQIGLQTPQSIQVDGFRNAMRKMPEVLDCYHITGEYDYILKVVLRNRKDLEHFIMNKISSIPGVARIHTNLVLAEVKSTMALPLE
ncbi:MAG: Lrp/AsnC family transcriptional regulator [Anaerolineae bacterium]|jgi:DNA-binding Lrp family transcriptional regulator|nr:Lrp/AsnC family transcriptional regulator [Anaerolineae bacterium]